MNASSATPVETSVSSSSARQRHFMAAGWMGLSAFLFACMVLFSRMAGARVSWPVVGGARCAIGALVALAVALLRKKSLTVGGSRPVWARSVFGTLSTILCFYVLGRSDITIGDATMLFSLSPVLVALLAPVVIPERASKVVGFALPLALGGVAMVVRPRFLFGGGPGAHLSFSALTLIAALSAAFFNSLSMLMLRRAESSKASPEAVALHYSITATIAFAVLAIPSFRVPSLHDALTLCASGGCAGLAQLAMTRAYALEKAALVAPYRLFEIVAAAVLGAIVLGERPALDKILGFGLVISSGVLVALRVFFAGRGSASTKR